MKQQSELTSALQHLRKAHQLLESRSVLGVSGQDRQNQLRARVMSIEEELESIREEAELRDDPVARIARGEGSDEDRAQVILYETSSG